MANVVYRNGVGKVLERFRSDGETFLMIRIWGKVVRVREANVQRISTYRSSLVDPDFDDCPDCGGQEGNRCGRCHGTGRVMKHSSICDEEW